MIVARVFIPLPFAIAVLLLAASPSDARMAQVVPRPLQDVRVLDSSHPRYGGKFGNAVAGVEDVDGDGRGDLLVGANDEDAEGYDYAGRVYVFSGTTGEILHELVSPQPGFGRGFGTSVAGVDDVDGDGRGDLLVGEPGHAGTSAIGVAYLFSGASGALIHEIASPTPTAGGQFGIWVAGVPDTDGDGRGDFLVGASHEAAGAGRAYVFSGGTGTLRYTLVSPHSEPSSFFGKAVAGVQDVDGDGRGDILIGASEEDDGAEQNTGRAYAFSGATGELLYTLLAPVPQAFGYFGLTVSGVPDVDGDGRGDMLVGALESVVHLFSGATGVHLRALVAPYPEGEPGFGHAVDGVPDVDGDGRGDLLVGARFAGDPMGLTRTGRAFVFSGATGVLLRTLDAPHTRSDSRFANGVAGVPDADGDGLGDFLVGAPEEGVAGVFRAGRAYLFTGGGAAGCAVSLAATVSPTVLRAGDVITFTVTVANDGTGPAPVDLWIEVEGSHHFRRIRLASGALPAGATVTRAIRARVPERTPVGDYTMDLLVGDFDSGSPCDVETFTITITPFARGEGGGGSWAFEVEGAEVFLVPQEAAASAAPTVSPNPASGRATVHYTTEEAADARVEVYDLLGRTVAVLVDVRQEAGAHAAPFEARGLPAGVYVVRVEVGASVATQRLTLVR